MKKAPPISERSEFIPVSLKTKRSPFVELFKTVIKESLVSKRSGSCAKRIKEFNKKKWWLA
jgi:hypothetical protein